ncbi:MAG: glycerol dehydratase reactivase beta/small subunit family protein [Syntrophobacteraceae bacterium]
MSTKPAVLILRAQSVQANRIEPVLWGIEEEGVPYEIRGVVSAEPTTELAKKAAQNSALNVGIAMNEVGEIVLHHRDLPVGMPLFAFSAGILQPEQLRRLGTNAGRLAKGYPLVLDSKDNNQG